MVGEGVLIELELFLCVLQHWLSPKSTCQK